MPSMEIMGIGILKAMGVPEVATLPEIGVVYKVDTKLTSEYLRKFLECPGYQTPFLTEDFHWRAAEPLLNLGYRDYELAFGNTWSLDAAGRMARNRGGFYFLKIVAQPSEKERARRIRFRHYWPYQWVRRNWPWRIAGGGEKRWWHYVWPIVAGGGRGTIACRWQRKPRFTWGGAEIVAFKPSGQTFEPFRSPIHPDTAKMTCAEFDRVTGFDDARRFGDGTSAKKLKGER